MTHCTMWTSTFKPIRKQRNYQNLLDVTSVLFLDQNTAAFVRVYKKRITRCKRHLFFLILKKNSQFATESRIRNLYFLKGRLNLWFWIIKVWGHLPTDKNELKYNQRKNRNLYCFTILTLFPFFEITTWRHF